MRPAPFIYIILLVMLSGCGPDKDPNIDSPSNGTINISVDESFRPVIEEQLQMYKETYPETTINAVYKTEADCLKDLIRDSATRMVIITRGLSEKEEKFFKDSLSYIPSWNMLARDGIAVLVSAKSKDTAFTMQELSNFLTGKDTSKQVVFDGLNATSTYRFVKDSLLNGAEIDTNYVKAAPSSEEVINYVAGNENAIGLVGISWIGNPEIPEQIEHLKKVKICYIRCEICPGKPFVKPDQASITTYKYPLVRGLYYVLKENYNGLGLGFTTFLRNERGQLIFRRFYLAPAMEFDIRDVKININ